MASAERNIKEELRGQRHPAGLAIVVRGADTQSWYPELPSHLQGILEQLMTGSTDITASRNLNISPRTFSRRVAELLNYLGVATRFQCGVEAERRGWTCSAAAGSFPSAKGIHPFGAVSPMVRSQQPDHAEH
jgi:DNA-binding NarL/FixJ family response regulator